MRFILLHSKVTAIENLLQAVSNKFTTKNYQIIKYGGKAITMIRLNMYQNQLT